MTQESRPVVIKLWFTESQQLHYLWTYQIYNFSRCLPDQWNRTSRGGGHKFVFTSIQVILRPIKVWELLARHGSASEDLSNTPRRVLPILTQWILSAYIWHLYRCTEPLYNIVFITHWRVLQFGIHVPCLLEGEERVISWISSKLLSLPI